MTAATLMIQGTTSDAGKTALVTGLCRLLSSQGYRVAPFKPQNMALNSAVTVDGGEIGRAQALQAQACGIDTHSDMNPILLKPNSETGCQVIVHGKAVANMNAQSYHKYKATVKKFVLDSYYRLSEQYDIILVEGAGSPAEINLRDNDIANMGFAEAIDCPVLLIADIERGGVFAHLVGTLQLLSQSEQNRIVGLLINRFRGDLDLLTPGIDWLVAYCNKPVLGVLPYLRHLHLEAEDSLSGYQQHYIPSGKNKLRIIIPKLPKISNATDFDPLKLHPQVELLFIDEKSAIPNADLIILPGSKNVRSDLAWLRQYNWQPAIQKHCRYGGRVLGICGGFQMLGNTINDPLGIEGKIGTSEGFGLLDIDTILEEKKQLHNVSGFLALKNTPLTGYEIHAGSTTGKALQNPAIHLPYRTDGAISNDTLIMGTYLHGLFESSASQKSLLEWAGLKKPEAINYHQRCEKDINRLATAIFHHIDMSVIEKLLNIKLHSKNVL